MKHRRTEERIIRLEQLRKARGMAADPVAQERHEWLHATMREIAKPQGNESLSSAWCRHLGISTAEFKRILLRGDVETAFQRPIAKYYGLDIFDDEPAEPSPPIH